jgi:glyoxylase-like metal-dependent hydrolase (beta-lactamase superfamily II)
MPHPTRRQFLRQSASCAAHVALAASALPRALRAEWTRPLAGPVVAQEKFGRLERIAEGVWALVSTPLGGDMTTVANGGLIAGRSGVLAVEGFMQPGGAQWLADQALALTGRRPTHVALTHYHADHVNGVAGYGTGDGAPAVLSTVVTRNLALERNRPEDAGRSTVLRGASLLEPGVLDLGGRTVRIATRAGHTASDAVIELEDPAITFCGDLVWNGMFPNYVDATPSTLGTTVRSLRRPGATYVPGHGPVGRDAEFDRYVAMLDTVEEAARRAHAAGTPAAEAGAAFALPPSLGEWVLFNKVFFERAFAAWYRELGG